MIVPESSAFEGQRVEFYLNALKSTTTDTFQSGSVKRDFLLVFVPAPTPTPTALPTALPTATPTATATHTPEPTPIPTPMGDRVSSEQGGWSIVLPDGWTTKPNEYSQNTARYWYGEQAFDEEEGYRILLLRGREIPRQWDAREVADAINSSLFDAWDASFATAVEPVEIAGRTGYFSRMSSGSGSHVMIFYIRKERQSTVWFIVTGGYDPDDDAEKQEMIEILYSFQIGD